MVDFQATRQLTPELAARDVRNPASLIGDAVRDVLAEEGGGSGATGNKIVKVKTVPLHLYNKRRWQSSTYGRNVYTAADGTQYVALWNEDQNPYLCVGHMDSDRWDTVINLRTITGDPFGVLTDDSHCTLSVFHDVTSGHTFIDGNNHGDPLRSARTLTAGDLSTLASVPVGGSTSLSNQATYPDIFKVGDTVLRTFRNGAAIAGQTMFQKFDRTSAAWSAPVVIIDGAPSSEGPYPCAAIVQGGKFGFFVTWREGGAADTNSGYTFIESADLGATFQRADGAAQTMPMTHANSVNIITLTTGSGMVNQSGGAYNEEGHPRSSIMFYDADGNTQYDVVRWDGNTWEQKQITQFTTRVETLGLTTLNLTTGRPNMFCVGNRDYIVGRSADNGMNGAPFIIDATEGADHRPVKLVDMDLAGWEPSAIDLGGLALGKLNLLVTPIDTASDSETNWDSQWGGVVSLDLEQIAAFMSGMAKTPTIRTVDSFGNNLEAVVPVTTAGIEQAIAATVLAYGLISRRSYGKGAQMFARLTLRVQFASGTTSATMFLRETPTAGSLPVRDLCRLVLPSTSFTGIRQTPWEPLSSPYTETDGVGRDARLIPRIVADNAAGLTISGWRIDIGVLDA